MPTLPGRLAEAKTYAERLFTYPRIANLEDGPSRALVTKALEGIELPGGARPEVTDAALDRMTAFSGGYPMFLQAIGKHAWAIAAGPTIDVDDARAAEEVAFEELARDLFASRWQRASPRQRDYLAAIARAGGSARTADAAAAAGFPTPSAASPVREELIDKGTIYPPRRGEIAFTVPQFDRFILRHLDSTAP